MSSLTQQDLAGALRSVVDGTVLIAGEPGYDTARTPFFAHRIGHPTAVVRPAHSGDVAATIRVAAGSGTPLFVRSGGHSWHSTGDGLLVDLGSLTEFDVDDTSRTMWVGGGLTAREVARALTPYSLAVGFGDTGTVGIGAITLGGGIGFLSRRLLPSANATACEGRPSGCVIGELEKAVLDCRSQMPAVLACRRTVAIARAP